MREMRSERTERWSRKWCPHTAMFRIYLSVALCCAVAEGFVYICDGNTHRVAFRFCVLVSHALPVYYQAPSSERFIFCTKVRSVIFHVYMQDFLSEREGKRNNVHLQVPVECLGGRSVELVPHAVTIH